MNEKPKHFTLQGTKIPSRCLNFNRAKAYAAMAEVITVRSEVTRPTKMELNKYLPNGNAVHARV